MTKPIIIDTDPGIDDIMMLLLALTHDDLDIKLITTSAGNQTQEKTWNNARRFVEYIGAEVEVLRGLEQPFFKKLEIADDVHGESGIGGVLLPEARKQANTQPAIQRMYEVLMNTKEKVTIVATGPLTNVAALLIAHPEVKPQIEQISLMGGAAKDGNVTPTAEFNIFVDPDAAEIVFQSGVPIVMSGLDVTHKAYLDQDDLRQMESIGTELSTVLASMLDYYMDAADLSPFHQDMYESVVRLHDLCAIGYVLDSSMFKGNKYYVTVERKSSLTEGTTVVDYHGRLGKEANAFVLYDVDRARFVDLFLQSFHRIQK